MLTVCAAVVLTRIILVPLRPSRQKAILNAQRPRERLRASRARVGDHLKLL
jgi:hypothetical protein